MAAGLEFFTSEVRPVDLDPLAYANRRNENAYRLNVITDPALRVIGFAVVAIGVWLHNATLLPAGTAPPIAPFVFLCVAYPLVSWATLALFYRSWKHLPFVLLFCDIGVLLAAVYFSGGERSYLFFLPLFRVVDQTHTSFRRAMLFGHVVVGGYALLMAWLMWSERHAVALGGEGAKLFALYASVLYTAFRARAAESSRRRMVAAARLIEKSNEALAIRSAELQASQQQLQRVTAQRERILESVAEGIVGFDTTGRITLANRRAAKTIGLEPQDLVGRPGHELAVHARVDGSICNGTDCPLEAALLSGREERGENAGFLRRDGTTVPVEFSSAPICEDGKLTGAVFSFRDISERLRLERELIAARDAAEEASRAKSQFLANMSHELRTPLNAIIGYAEMLAEDALDNGNDETLADLQKITTAAKHLLSLLSDVIDIAKIEAGRMDVSLEEVDAKALLFEIRTAMEPACRQKRNALTVAADAARMKTDAAKLRRILLNLASNANKFTDGGRIELSAAPVGNRVVFRVADSGIGIGADQLGRLFQPFTQADGSSTRRHGGTGLGLAIASRLAGMLGAEIAVESAPGSGATFTVSLAAVPSQSGSAQEQV